LKTPFKISFKKKTKNIDKEEFVRLFLINSKGTLYDKIERVNDRKIIIKGNFFSFNPLDNVPWNLWIGFANKAEIDFTRDNTVIYTVDFTYGIIYFITVILFFLLNPLIFSIKIDYPYLIFLVVVFAVLFANLILKILLHRGLFNKTIKLENRLLGNYDWTEILKNKTDKELRNIIKGNTTLTEEIRKLAKIELEKRRNNK
jgi:hypothetical protein